MKKSVLLLVVVFFSLLCGCTGYKEIDRGYLVTAIGFSEDDNDFSITLEAISSSDTSDKPSETITLQGKGKSFDEAFLILEKQLVKPLYFEHLGTMIISDTLDDTQIKSVIIFYQKLPSTNFGIYLIKTNDINALFNNETSSGVLGYDIIGLIKNFEKRNNIKLSNQLYQVNRNDLSEGVVSIPAANITNGKLELTSANGGHYG